MNLTLGLFLGLYFAILYITLYWLVAFLKNRHRIKKDPKPTRFPKISVLIPVYNDCDNVVKAISSCKELNYPKVEIVVVNDGSTDATMSVCKKIKGVKLIDKSHTGKANSLNVGLKRATGEIISVLDADSYFTKDAFRNMVGYFDNPKVGAVMPIARVSSSKNIIEKIQWIEYILSMFMRKVMSEIDSLYLTHGVGTLFRKSLLEEVGGFDEKNLTEDLEISLKIIDAGYSIAASINAVTYTRPANKFKELFHQRLRWNVGLLHNVKKFKHMFFNKKLGNLGMFVLPLSIIWVPLLLFLTYMMYSDTVNSFVRFIRNTLLVNFDWSYLLKDILEFDILFSTSIVTLFTWMFAMLFIVTVVVTLHSMSLSSEENKKAAFYTIPYAMFYTAMMSLFWVAAIGVWLVKGGGRKWEKRI
jgi:cellulose synthase/poly-beta-1,6-N-acetylglucosamine synthase-like glycosyltransferase